MAMAYMGNFVSHTHGWDKMVRNVVSVIALHYSNPVSILLAKDR